MEKEIVFWGSEPPPIGGMTIHLKRLSVFLRNKEWTVFQYNFSDIKKEEDYIINVNYVWLWYLKLWLFPSPSIHYVITTTSYVRFLASLLTLRGKKIIIRVGGRSLQDGLNSNLLEKYLNILSLKLCSSFIGVSSEICKIASKYADKSKINHIPGFIPPCGEIIPPHEVVDFFNDSNLKIVITGQVVLEYEEDIYGLYHALDSLKILKDRSVLFKCCIVSYTISGNNDYKISKYRELIETKGLQDEVLLFHNTAELWPILKISDVFIRTTITDGDANSIREAFFLNKIVIASNCVARPLSCILYKNLNSEDLADKIQEWRKANIYQEVDIISNGSKILKLLNNLYVV
jgi:hypothetical protein